MSQIFQSALVRLLRTIAKALVWQILILTLKEV